ncbi:hypothetical protein IMCC3317_13200 [Kordia antarctica]|uniref:Uncharacterized protein n=1 Tax=Kordia antarctica TaxID=1218801 RepID=A0A7L4ZH78_9FLAO|nr:hypothetical protein IMCC3317_13200 [Kordia antarctica]
MNQRLLKAKKYYEISLKTEQSFELNFSVILKSGMGVFCSKKTKTIFIFLKKLNKGQCGLTFLLKSQSTLTFNLLNVYLSVSYIFSKTFQKFFEKINFKKQPFLRKTARIWCFNFKFI